MRAAMMQEFKESKKTYELDEEDMEDLKEDIAKVSRLASQIMELTGQLCDIFKDAAFDTVRDNAQTFFATQLQAYQSKTDDEVQDSLCFFCDFVDNTKARDASDLVIELAKKFHEVMHSELFKEDPDIRQTCLYGLGSFGYHVPSGAYGALLPTVVKMLKDVVMAEDAFGEDNIVLTENAMAGIARLSYKQMDGATLQESDLIGVLNKMPFTAEDIENQNSHQLLVDQFAKADSIINSPNVKPAATAVIQRIIAHIDEKGNESPKILSHLTKAQMQSMSF